MTNIKLFICSHQPSYVPEHPLLVPIQVGAALNKEYWTGFLHDDTGDNISVKNRSYCELTAQYWAWKNDNSDYVGFFHYRRYLYPSPSAKRPYYIECRPTPDVLVRLGFPNFGFFISQYDLIAPIGEDMHISVKDHYAAAPYHHSRDLDLVIQILSQQHPEYQVAAAHYLSGTVCYFGNIFIMRRTVFEDYCAWLFPVLEEFDRKRDISNWTTQEKRVDGYLAERLFGIYYIYQKERGRLRVAELPRVHFDTQDGSGRFKRRLLYRLFPPGTRRRAFTKGFAHPD